jgi:hypothetical protein
MSKEDAVEAYSYVNIFETKGIEYLLVIAFLVGFMLFLRVVRTRPAIADTCPTESTVRPMPICFSRRTCPHKKAFEGTLRVAADTGIGLDERRAPHLCACPDLEFVESEVHQQAV